MLLIIHGIVLNHQYKCEFAS